MTAIVLISGTALIWHFGDVTAIIALVASGWTLVLTFWFRLDAGNGQGGS